MLEKFEIKNTTQLYDVLVKAYTSGKTEFQLKFTKFSKDVHHQLTETLKKLPGFEIFYMTPNTIHIKDLGDIAEEQVDFMLVCSRFQLIA